jgi:hypothetical protein
MYLNSNGTWVEIPGPSFNEKIIFTQNHGSLFKNIYMIILHCKENNVMGS